MNLRDWMGSGRDRVSRINHGNNNGCILGGLCYIPENKEVII